MTKAYGAKFLWAGFLVFTMSLATSAQPPVVQVPAKTGYLLEVDSNPKASTVVVDPQGIDAKLFEGTKLFIESAVVKGGIIRVLQLEKGDATTPDKIKWYIWTVGPPPAPKPTVLPTAKVVADPASLLTSDLKPVTLTWETSPPDVKVTLNQGDGPEDVENNGSAVVLPQRTTLYTIAATNPEGTTAYSQTIVTVSDKPPPDVIPPGPVLETGFRVLVIHQNKNQLTKEQLLLVDSTKLRTYLDSVCAKGPNGQPEHRFYAEEQLSSIPDNMPNIKKMSQLPRQSLPWVIISPAKGTTGYSGALPANEAALMELLKRYL